MMKTTWTLAGVLWLAAACGSVGDADFQGEKTSSQYKGGKGRNVLVVVATNDVGAREDFESQFAIEGVDMGLKLTPSYRLVPAFKDVTRERLTEEVKSGSFDRVLLVRALPESVTKGEHGYIEDYYSSTQVYNDLWNTWQGTTMMIYSPSDPPPSLAQYRQVTVETLLYDTADASLIWDSRTRVTQSQERGKSAKTYIRKNLKRLTGKGLL